VLQPSHVVGTPRAAVGAGHRIRSREQCGRAGRSPPARGSPGRRVNWPRAPGRAGVGNRIALGAERRCGGHQRAAGGCYGERQASGVTRRSGRDARWAATPRHLMSGERGRKTGRQVAPPARSDHAVRRRCRPARRRRGSRVHRRPQSGHAPSARRRRTGGPDRRERQRRPEWAASAPRTRGGEGRAATVPTDAAERCVASGAISAMSAQLGGPPATILPQLSDHDHRHT
jgi:hypothetical protein